MVWITLTRRYWFWQHKKMRKDGVGYLVSGGIRPRAIKWIKASYDEDGRTEIPAGWRVIGTERFNP